MGRFDLENHKIDQEGGKLMTLLGEYRHVIDTKNRLFIPAKFREELGETFYITRKVMEKCLAIH